MDGCRQAGREEGRREKFKVIVVFILYSLYPLNVKNASLYRFFTKMPHEHYLEVTRLLLNVASDDINRADEIKTLIKVSLIDFFLLEII